MPRLLKALRNWISPSSSRTLYRHVDSLMKNKPKDRMVIQIVGQRDSVSADRPPHRLKMLKRASPRLPTWPRRLSSNGRPWSESGTVFSRCWEARGDERNHVGIRPQVLKSQTSYRPSPSPLAGHDNNPFSRHTDGSYCD